VKFLASVASRYLTRHRIRETRNKRTAVAVQIAREMGRDDLVRRLGA
jgi:hypothetical protein